MSIINLRKMEINQTGIVSSVNVSGELGRRIRDMGLTKGVSVLIQGRAPLYDPVAIRLRGFTLSLRNKEADFINVEVQDKEVN
jgi:ferrous iron transport protein A